MSTAAIRFELQIRFLNVPEALVGVPLPAEVVSPTGSVQPVVLTMAENQPSKTLVGAPGQYLVRAELPTGRWVAQVAQVPDDPATPDALSATATFDLGLPAAMATQATPAQEEKGGWLRAGRRWALGTYRGWALGKYTASYLGPPLPHARLEYGWFEKWGESSADGIDLVLRLEGTPKQELDLPGSVTLHPHPGWVEDRLLARPLFVHVRTLSAEAGRSEALVLWPPAEGTQPLTLQIDEKEHDPEAPSLLAATTSGDRTVDALFAYIGTGALASARLASKTLIAEAEGFLQSKVVDPVRACLAAYTLLRVGAINHPQWLANLANMFFHLPDGNVVYAWHLLRTGESELARSCFLSALAKGVPMYSEGVRLLRDGLNFVAGLFPDDPDIKAGAALANTLASVAILESQLTCLRIGKRLRVVWS